MVNWAATLRIRAQVADAAEHFGERHLGADAHVGGGRLLAADDAAAAVEVADDVADVLVGDEDVDLHDRLEQLGTRLGHGLAEGGLGGDFEGELRGVSVALGPARPPAPA
jgi:hypothetical protein